jgi:hypothetical protein
MCTYISTPSMNGTHTQSALNLTACVLAIKSEYPHDKVNIIPLDTPVMNHDLKKRHSQDDFKSTSLVQRVNQL